MLLIEHRDLLKTTVQVLDAAINGSSQKLLGSDYGVEWFPVPINENLKLYKYLKYAEPTRRPLKISEIPPYTLVRHPSWDEHVYSVIYPETESVVHIFRGNLRVTLVNLMGLGYLIKRPTDTDWQPCYVDT